MHRAFYAPDAVRCSSPSTQHIHRFWGVEQDSAGFRPLHAPAGAQPWELDIGAAQQSSQRQNASRERRQSTTRRTQPALRVGRAIGAVVAVIANRIVIRIRGRPPTSSGELPGLLILLSRFEFGATLFASSLRSATVAAGTLSRPPQVAPT